MIQKRAKNQRENLLLPHLHLLHRPHHPLKEKLQRNNSQ